MDIKDLKIGDRVRFLNAHKHKGDPDVYPAVGTIGRVVDLDEDRGIARVKWPEGSTSDNDIWWCDPEDIKLVVNENESDDRWSDGYNSGLNDAWEAAKKICSNPADGGLTWSDMEGIFGTTSVSGIIKRFTPFEAISKIREFEEKQKAEEEIKVGDECVYKSKHSTNPNFIVTRIYHEDGNGFFDGVFVDGSLIEDGILELIKKTGRHFPQIVEVLEQMKGE